MMYENIHLALPSESLQILTSATTSHSTTDASPVSSILTLLPCNVLCRTQQIDPLLNCKKTTSVFPLRLQLFQSHVEYPEVAYSVYSLFNSHCLLYPDFALTSLNPRFLIISGRLRSQVFALAACSACRATGRFSGRSASIIHL